MSLHGSLKYTHNAGLPNSNAAAFENFTVRFQLPPSPSKSHGPSSWSYIASFKWARPIAVLVLLYCVALLLLLNLFWQLPSRDTLSSKAHLQGLRILELVLSCASCSLHDTLLI